LATSNSSKKLDLSKTSVTDTGLLGLECIPSLEDLSLECCQQVTSVSTLREIAILKGLKVVHPLSLRGMHSSFVAGTTTTVLLWLKGIL
jgi:hypothetical protein